MTDMRATAYAMWPWPEMLDVGERIKVRLRTPNGKLYVFGTIEEVPHRIEGERNKLRFKINTQHEYAFTYEPDVGEAVTIASNPSYGILSGVSVTGWFVVDGEYENIWGMHFDDLEVAQARRQKRDPLSDATSIDSVPGDEEPAR